MPIKGSIIAFDELTFALQAVLPASVQEGNASDETLQGVAGNNLIRGRGGDDSLLGFAGADTLEGNAGNDTLRGHAGQDRLYGGDDDDKLFGGDGADKLFGQTGSDDLFGGVGQDTLFGGRGFDLLNGGFGADSLSGDKGNDTLYGEAGRDTLDGGDGNDIAFGGADNDTIRGAAGNDTLFGGSGDDLVSGGGGSDNISGGGGSDTLSGGGGNDRLEGMNGADRILGDAGSDRLFGGNGNDTLIGGRGFDKLEGGGGNDQLFGGMGGDRYVFAGQWGNDTVTGFDADQRDWLDFSASGLSFSDLTLAQTAQGALISAGNRTVLLEGVQVTDVDTAWFDFGLAKSRPDDDEDTGEKIETPDPIIERNSIGTATISDAQDLIGIDEFRADERFAGYTGQNYAVVVLDTGIDLNHTAFGPDANNDGVSDRLVYNQDFSSDGDGTVDDANGHGTNVASIIGSSADGYGGIAPGVDIITLQVLGNNGSGSNSGIEAALQWVVENAAAYNVVAVNMSLGAGDNTGSTATHPVFGDEFAALAAEDIIVTVAAGNDYFRYQQPGGSSISTDPNVIPVGAVWQGNFGGLNWASGAKDNTTGADRITSFSQRSATNGTVFAPGALILGAAPGGGTGEQGGTSQAAPQVAGMAVLAQQIAEALLGRRLTVTEFHNLLIETADMIYDGDDEDDNVTNLETNVPRVNMYTLAQRIAEMAGGTEPVTPDDDFSADTDTTGQVTIGGTEEGTLETNSDRDWFAVTLQSGMAYRFTVTGADGGGGTLADPYATLLNASGEVLATNDDASEHDSAIEFTASANGTYYLAASGYGGSTGTYTVAAVALQTNVDDDLPADTTTSSTITTNGSATRGVIETSGDRDWHRLELAAGQTIVVTLSGNTLADPAMDIYDASGTLLLSDDNGGGGTAAAVTIEAKTAGTVYVGARSATSGGTGSYRITAQTVVAEDGDLPDDQTTLANLTLDVPFTSEIEIDGDRDWVAVTLAAGSVYQLSLAGSGEDDPLADAYLRVYDARGNELAYDDDTGDGRNSLIETFSPVTSGTYFLSAASYGDEGTGVYEMLVTEVTGGIAGDIPANANTTSTVTLDAPVTSTIDSDGDRDWHRVSLTAGQSYLIELDDSGTDALDDPFLRIYNAAGESIAENDDSGEGRNSRIVITPAANAEYFLSAASYGDTGTGRYTLSVTDLSSIDDYASDTSTEGLMQGAGSLNGAIQFAGDSDWIGVQVQAGATYRFDLTGRGNNPLSDPQLTLRDASGRSIGYDDDSGQGNASSITFNAAATGTIYLDVQGVGDITGGWKLEASVSNSGGDDHPDDIGNNATIVAGTPVGATINRPDDLDVFHFTAVAGNGYTVEALGSAHGHGLLDDPILGVFDSAGNLIQFNDDSGDGTTNSRIDFQAASSGDYYVAVAAYENSGTGSYILSLTENAASSDDYGTTPQTAGQFNEYNYAGGELETVGDRDWVAVYLQAYASYRFELYGASFGYGTLDDPMLRLYGIDAETELARNDDNGFSKDSGLNFTPTQTGVYYLEAAAFNDAGTGDWVMSGYFL